MHLVRFTCNGFRALTEVCLEPGSGVTVIRGDNAQGKTSLLEAILFTATARSHRTTIEADLVAHGQDRFHLCAEAARRDREVTIEARWWQNVKRFKVNGVAQTRVSDILGKISVVLFSPEDIILVKGTGAHRRRFLDMELSQISPAYLNALQQYRQAVRQRNELLRRGEQSPDLLDPWEAQLAEHGAVLIRERERFVQQLAGLAAESYARIADGERLELSYEPDVDPDQSLGAVLRAARGSDFRRMTTTRGPHRDDLGLVIAGQPARAFASQGQQKTAALALKLAELELVRERTGEYPILLLDEVLSDLDEKRARLLFETVAAPVQCIVTTAAALRSEDLIRPPYARYQIQRGRLEKL